MSQPVFDTYVQKVLPNVAVGIRMRDSSLHLWLERMMTCFGDLNGKTAMDFGSGSGHKALLMALYGAKVTAVELNPAEIESLRNSAQKMGVNVDIVAGGTEALAKFPDQSFDRILLSEVIEHIPVSRSMKFRDFETTLLEF
jgi:2-polyprenyl-3-methyl-5-hydroxy-6-metoxy-1,4-benzoquinol methylase